MRHERAELLWIKDGYGHARQAGVGADTSKRQSPLAEEPCAPPSGRDMSARLGILLSGAGTTYHHLACSQASGSIPASIGCVISSNAQAGGLAIAKQFGHPHAVASNSDAVTQLLLNYHITHIAMCGWLRFWDPPAPWQQRTVNIHPSLLPAFGGQGMYGMHVHRAVIAAGVRISGCTAHLVSGHYDSGAIIAQRAVPVFASDDAAQLSQRVQSAERWLYPQVVAALVQDAIHIDHHGRPTVAGHPAWQQGEISDGHLE